MALTILEAVDEALELVELAYAGTAERWSGRLDSRPLTEETVLALATMLGNHVAENAERRGVGFSDVLHGMRLDIVERLGAWPG